MRWIGRAAVSKIGVRLVAVPAAVGAAGVKSYDAVREKLQSLPEAPQLPEVDWDGLRDRLPSLEWVRVEGNHDQGEELKEKEESVIAVLTEE
eukprot:Nk52_evm1s671 gene=Nk52_evmTU1s671